MKEWIKSRDWPLIAVFLLCIFLCLFLVKTRVYGQELIPQKIDANTISKAKVGDVLMRKGNTEYRKASIAGQITAKVYSAPQWNENGSPLLTYDASTNTVTSRMRTVQYIPDAETKKLTKKVEKGNAVVKEFYTVPDNKTTQLTWEVKTTANETRFDSKTGTLNYFDSQGILLFTTLPPVAWDANKLDVPVEVSFINGTLSYILSSGGWTYPITVDPTSVTATNDGRMWVLSEVDYASSRDATTGDMANDYVFIGQRGTGSLWIVFRSFASFILPDMASLSVASLYLYGYIDYSTIDFDIYLHTSTYSNPLAVGDFDLFDGHQTSGAYNGTILNDAWNSSSYSATWNQIDFNAAGLSAVFAKKNDTFKIALISKEDYDNSEPTDFEYLEFYESVTSGKEPYLSITYTPPISVPTVTTQAASSVEVTTATGNGNITDTGGENCTRRGFCYMTGTSGDPTTANSVAYDDGDFGTGAYTKGITGLSSGTSYRVRAYAVNSAGTGYGTTVQILTNNTRSTLSKDGVVTPLSKDGVVTPLWSP